MPTSVSLPALGESVTEGTVTRWLKQVGDTVAVDEPLLEVSTDKVDTEIPSPVAGTLLEIKAAEDETVEVGAELAVIGDAGESGRPRRRTPRQSSPPAAAGRAPARQPPAAQAAARPAGRRRSRLRAAAGPGRPGRLRRPPQLTGPAPTSGGAASGGTSVTLPALGESVTEGTVTRWLKQVGDDVAVDEPLLEVSTDKVDTEIPSPVAGKLLEIMVAEDETVEVGAELAIVGAADAAPAAAPPPAAPAAARSPPPSPGPAAGPAPAAAPAPQAAPRPGSGRAGPGRSRPRPRRPPPPGRSGRIGASPQPPAPSTSTPRPRPRTARRRRPDYVTPLVRKLAAEHQVDLDAVQGTGVGGRIRKQDVIAAAEAKKAASSRSRRRRSPRPPPRARGEGPGRSARCAAPPRR